MAEVNSGVEIFLIYRFYIFFELLQGFVFRSVLFGIIFIFILIFRTRMFPPVKLGKGVI